MDLVPRGCGDTMACPSCGSWAVKADRVLAGRMICARCGHPLGLGVSPSLTRSGRRPRLALLPRRWRVWLGLAGLVGVSAVLAAQTPVPGWKIPLPPTLPGAPPGTGGLGKPGGLGM